MADEDKERGRPKGEDKKQIIVRIPVDLIDRIRDQAEANRRTISAEVQIAIEKGLLKEKPAPK